MDKLNFPTVRNTVAILRCILASSFIIMICLVLKMKNDLINPIREWMAYIFFYSCSIPILLVSVSIVDVMVYSKSHPSLDQAEKSQAMISITNKIQFPLYLIITATEIFLLVIYCNSIYYTLHTISKELNTTLNDGLSRYYSNSEWQHFWDNFQQRYYCCGNMKSTDWFQVAWVSPIIVPTFSSLKKYTQENGKFIIPSSPASCCLLENTCNVFTDCEQPDPAIYYELGCYSVILKMFNSLGNWRFICYAVIIIQILTYQKDE